MMRQSKRSRIEHEERVQHIVDDREPAREVGRAGRLEAVEG